MFGIGTGELLVIFLIALLLFGPQKLPEIARWLGRATREARKAWEELQRQLMNNDE
ncbi:Sec-independent protein translocase subunit TatA/TatB [Fervidibacter sacchari]|jgi:Sec-independent protein secretion pathway components|uniref:Tat protein translocase TatB subunit n=1 Tax=Candidatus Fervidibacter sacchari TaxID=1448929 RepID=A0ABT2ELI8_9BACT|nr:twin-arginine translocase TatA/TatE family subunit [Candidatus Fervidibacter sacchari]MCS3917818.1 Tat protein translocase TatB subunit [Candidatus Fervidibacter sacchari]WKU15638.1 twin-arginine translocase TatA/TatE family subunit [Candidatus Fervidibacter sacchari]